MTALRVAGLVLAVMFGGQSVAAAELTLLRSFPSEGPSGLAYDGQLCALWVANETSEVTLVNLWGEELRNFTSALPRVDAVAVTGAGLLLSDGSGGYQRVDRQGTAMGAPFRLPNALVDTDGLYFDEATQEYWITDDSVALVARLRPDGHVRVSFDGHDQSPQLTEPQGLTRDPASGNVLVVDDADGSDSLFEFSGAGVLLDVIPLAAGGLRDAEGISIQPASSTVFVAFDEGNAVAVYSYAPSAKGLSPSRALPENCVISGFQSEKPPV